MLSLNIKTKKHENSVVKQIKFSTKNMVNDPVIGPSD